MIQKPRAILYVDGFNLYHPIHDLGANHLKWLDLAALGRLICQDRSHDLVGVTYCTAFQRNDPAKMARHKTYIAALESTGMVKTEFGHYLEQDTPPCSNCGFIGTKETEKQTDINVALSLFSDAMLGKFDWAYLLSADSDQAATARYLKSFFREKQIVTVVPPGKEVSKNIANFVDGKRRLTREDLEKCRFNSVLMFSDGRMPIRCPREYDLPKK
jgi:NYN domain